MMLAELICDSPVWFIGSMIYVFVIIPLVCWLAHRAH